MIGPPASVIVDRIRNGSLNPLIINLYSTDKGYSVVFPACDGRKWTTRCFSYEDECELLDDVEKNRLPLFLIDLIDRYCCASTTTSGGENRSTIYYQGCIGAEVRDFRGGGIEERKHDISYAVLRPTPATLLQDLENLQYGFFCMEKGKELETVNERTNSTENADSIFSRRARYENQRLILEADFWRLIAVGIDRNNSDSAATRSAKRKFVGKSTKNLRYDIRARQKRQRRLCLEQQLPITQWIIENSTLVRCKFSSKSINPIDQSRSISTPGSAGASQWKPMLPTMVKTPSEIGEKRLQRAQLQQEQQQEGVDGMELVEEYGIELPTTKQKTKTRIRIYKRILDSVYVGHLRMERDEVASGNDGNEDESADTASECGFLLGSETGSRSYIRQYLDMVSEGGRRPLTLTRRVPGKPLQVMPQPVARGIDVGTAIATPALSAAAVVVSSSTSFQTATPPAQQSQHHLQYIASRPTRSSSRESTEQQAIGEFSNQPSSVTFTSA